MTFRSIMTVILWVPIAAIIVIGAVANRHLVRLTIDPFNTGLVGDGVELPLFALLFGTLAIGVFVGGLASWLRQGKNRRRGAEYSAEAGRLRGEVTQLRNEIDSNRVAAIAPPVGSRDAA